MLGSHFAGCHIVRQDSRKLRRGAALKQFDHRLFAFAVDPRQAIVVNLADDAVGVPVAKPLDQVFARVAVNASIDIEQPGQLLRPPATWQAAGVEIALACRGDNAAHDAAGVGIFRRQYQRHPDDLRRF